MIPVTRVGNVFDYGDSRIVVPYKRKLDEPWLFSNQMWCGMTLEGMSPFWMNFILNDAFTPSLVPYSMMASSRAFFSIADRLHVMNVECPEVDQIIEEAGEKERTMAANIGRSFCVTRTDSDAFEKMQISPRSIDPFIEHLFGEHDSIKEVRGRIERLSFSCTSTILFAMTMTAYGENEEVIDSYFPVIGVATANSTKNFWLTGHVSPQGLQGVSDLSNWKMVDGVPELIVKDWQSHVPAITAAVCLGSTPTNGALYGNYLKVLGIDEDDAPYTGYFSPPSLI